MSRWTPTAKLAAHASVRDRVSRVGYYTVPNALTVINHDPDEQLPAVAELTLSSPTGSFPLDVRTASSSVTVRAHLTDEQSGLTVAPRACLTYPFDGDYRGAGCRVLQLTSGTRHDGWWRAILPVAQGAVAGDWNVSVLAPDEAHPDAQLRWLGPDQYALETRRSSAAQLADRARPLPAGAGRFAVLGVGDYTAPELSRTTISPSSVDSLTGPAHVGVDIRATDVEGVTAVGAWLESAPTTAPVRSSCGSRQSSRPAAPGPTASGTSTSRCRRAHHPAVTPSWSGSRTAHTPACGSPPPRLRSASTPT